MFRGSEFKSRVDVPRALVVLKPESARDSLQKRRKRRAHQDIRADLANVLGKAVAVKVVVLDLEVFSQWDQDRQSEFVRRLVGHSALHTSSVSLISWRLGVELTICMANATGR